MAKKQKPAVATDGPRIRNKGIRLVRVADIEDNPLNFRTHPEAQRAAFAGVETELGFYGYPDVYETEQGTIRLIDGQLRKEHLLSKYGDEATIEVNMTDFDEAEAKKALLTHDPLSAMAEADKVLLDQLLREVDTGDEALQQMMTDLADESGLYQDDSDATEIEEDEVPDIPEESITKPGDLWLLGDHRVLCGDSTKAGDVDRLMAGEKADLCFTSPPYALGKSVALSGNKAMSAMANAYGDHEDNADNWGRLMRGWFSASDAAVIGVWVVNVQPLAGNKRELVRFIADNAGRLVDVATWDKGHAQPPMAAGVMASRYEWMIIFAPDDDASRSIPLSSWRGTVQSVYTGPPQRSNEFASIHAATMPMHVAAWVMQTLCDQSKSVYEPFCGTGTTLIAAEQLSRKCYGMEISPQYCDVIVKRWENLTGKKAVLEAAK